MDNDDPDAKRRATVARLITELANTRDTLMELSLTLQDFQFEFDTRERLKIAEIAQLALDKAKSPIG